ncbi:MAG TPA: hypothetical protein VEQ85_06095 [Lacipirellulaceae bacterium]|nr:hypothetical protein [Lacipirellulaceae bacterium]
MRYSLASLTLLTLALCAGASGCAPEASHGDWVTQFAAVVGDPTRAQPAHATPATAEPSRVVAEAPRRRVHVDKQVAPASLAVVDEHAGSAPTCTAGCPEGCGDACCSGTPGVSCSDCPLGQASAACHCCLAGRRCPILDHKMLKRPQPGPPPVSYVPPMPPKFLPVPTRPTLSPARPDAPDAWRGDVEVGFRRELRSPGRD